MSLSEHLGRMDRWTFTCMDGQKLPLELRGPKKESREAPKRWGKEERKERKKIINIA